MYLHILYWQEGKYWIAKCLENSIASQGLTKKEAQENIKEAIELTLEEKKPEYPQISNIQTEELTIA
jgi:predicted RNase H-like HicB family nuclease